jgi:hypothetical protein
MAASLAGNPDAELPQLLADFEAAVRATDEVRDAIDYSAPFEIILAAEKHGNEVQQEAMDVFDEIVDTPALTLEGLKIKARAFRHYMEWMYLEHESQDCEGELALSLIPDLIGHASA